MNSQLAHLPQALPQLTDPLEQFLAGQMSESTQRAYRADIESFFQFLEVEQIDLLEAQQVTFHQVIAWRNALANEGYKRTTINRKLASVRAGVGDVCRKTRRKPRALKLWPGASWPCLAERKLFAPKLIQAPPRKTLPPPDAGPVGSITGLPVG